MKFCEGQMTIAIYDTQYPIDDERSHITKEVSGYLCEEEPSMGIHKVKTEWHVNILDIGQELADWRKPHLGTCLAWRKTLEEAKEVVQIVHENIDEFNLVLKAELHTDYSIPQWLIDIRAGNFKGR